MNIVRRYDPITSNGFTTLNGIKNVKQVHQRFELAVRISTRPGHKLKMHGSKKLSKKFKKKEELNNKMTRINNPTGFEQ